MVTSPLIERARRFFKDASSYRPGQSQRNLISMDQKNPVSMQDQAETTAWTRRRTSQDSFLGNTRQQWIHAANESLSFAQETPMRKLHVERSSVDDPKYFPSHTQHNRFKQIQSTTSKSLNGTEISIATTRLEGMAFKLDYTKLNDFMDGTSQHDRINKKTQPVSIIDGLSSHQRVPYPTIDGLKKSDDYHHYLSLRRSRYLHRFAPLIVQTCQCPCTPPTMTSMSSFSADATEWNMHTTNAGYDTPGLLFSLNTLGVLVSEPLPGDWLLHAHFGFLQSIPHPIIRFDLQQKGCSVIMSLYNKEILNVVRAITLGDHALTIVFYIRVNEEHQITRIAGDSIISHLQSMLGIDVGRSDDSYAFTASEKRTNWRPGDSMAPTVSSVAA